MSYLIGAIVGGAVVIVAGALWFAWYLKDFWRG